MPSCGFDGKLRWFSTIKWQQNSNTVQSLHGCESLKTHWSMHTSTSSASTATSLSSALYSSGDVYMMMGFPHGSIIFRWRCSRWQSQIRAISSSSLWKTIILHFKGCFFLVQINEFTAEKWRPWFFINIQSSLLNYCLTGMPWKHQPIPEQAWGGVVSKSS